MEDERDVKRKLSADWIRYRVMYLVRNGMDRRQAQRTAPREWRKLMRGKTLIDQ